uniref:Uncharacterized protein n=1 Tax=Arundo donax TaxID=35708 RepID=A0A0A8Y1I1_ARUDO
MRHHSPLHLWT